MGKRWLDAERGRVVAFPQGIATMPTISHDETFRRLVVVEGMVHERGWSTATVEALTKELQVNRSTIYDYWRKVKAYTRRGVTLDIEKWRRQQMIDLDNIKMQAIREKDLPSAIRAIETQAKIVGTIAPTNVNVNHTTTVSPAMAVRLSGLSVTELQQIAQKPDEPVIDAQFEPILVKDGGEPG